MSFKDGRIGVGKDPIFPLDISGSCRIDGDLILGGRFSDSQGNAIQLGSGSGATSTPDQNQNGLPSWSSGTISTQGLGVFKGKMDSNSIYITGDNTKPTNLNGANYNCTLGISAGQNITSGDSNVLIGYAAGLSTTSHNSNIAIGMQSLYTSPAVRSYCVGIGHQALYSWNGDMNTAIGYVAAQYCHGAYNTAVGGFALQGYSSAQGPDYSVAVGYQAGRYQGESDYNIWIGSESGPQTSGTIGSQTGDHNIAIGKTALSKIQGGEDNICIGYEAGSQNTAGNYNVCVGRRSGQNITDSYNTLIGGNCGGGMTTGGQNTVVGYEAYNCSGLPGTRKYNVFIGMQSGYRPYCDSNVGVGYRTLYNKKAYVCTAIGYQCMGSYSPDSDHVGYNTGVGCNVLRTVQGSSTNQGCYNTVMGHHAAYNLTTGYKNVIIGSHAANNNTHLNQSVAIGHYAGFNCTNSTANVIVGHQAGMVLTTGGNNTLLGYNAGYGVTGGQNICIGYQTAYNTTSNSGHNNVFMGQVNGYSITSGYENVCIGREVGYYLTSGFRNIFMGTYAGYASSSAKNTANYNVGIGYNALRYVSSGSENICIGYSCGESITSGQRNVCLGRTAAQSITTGGYNVCIGMQTGDSITTANSNVFIGYQAGEKITTHAANTFIGAQAGCYMTSGYNNVCIGHYAGASSGGGNYELYINSYVGSYGTDSFIYGNMNMSSNPYLRLNARLEMYDDDIVFNRRGRGLVGSYATESGNLNPIWTLGTGYTENDGETIPRYSIGYCYPNACDVPGDTNHKWGLYVDATAYGSPDWLGYANWFLSGGKGGYSYMRSGRFGIGVTSPKYPLDVMITNTNSSTTYWNANNSINDGASYSTQNDTNHWGSNTGQGQIGDLDSGTDATYGINVKQIAAHFNHAIWVSHGGGLLVSSDERIKTNIIDVPDNLALETVRNIPCRFYNYKDTLERGLYKTIGFIAQEVKKFLPMAVSKEKRFIPNVLRKLTNISWEEITDNSSNQYKLITDLSECSGVKYKFYVNDGENEIRKEVIGNSDNSFTFDTSYNNVFCYGKEVDDFHTLDKNKLFALNFSATQELDRKVTALETVGNKDHNVKILNLYKENEALKARLAKIEAFLGI